MNDLNLILQIVGGGCYLLNKILFAFAEGRTHRIKRLFRLCGWVLYISGVPAWVVILSGKHNWIAASIEAGGIPAMLFGLYTVYTDRQRPSRRFDRIAAIFTYASVVLGIGYSLYDFGGITAVSQLLEMGVTLGFLLGSYLMAKNNSGWLYFMLMNGSMATLMHLQNKPLLAGQQLLSLCFVVYGYIMSRRTKHDHPDNRAASR